ncbi:MAG TPA: hypothetical protein VIF57_21330 [Polyangia bacterium]|jgi:hypothetical protein
MRSPAVAGAAVLIAALAGGLAGSGCDSDENMRLRPDPETCAANWRAVFSPDQSVLAPFDLTGDPFIRTRGDRVFVNPNALGRAPAGVRSLPASGGPDSIVFDGWARAFWIEDDQVLAVSASALQRRPLAGGSVETILDLPWLTTLKDALYSPWELDREALYWAEYDYVQSTLWRAPRDGGEMQQLATLPPAGDGTVLQVGTLHLLDDGRLVSVSRTQVFMIPKAGGAMQQMKVADNLADPLGLASDGTMLWTQFAGNSDGNHPRYSLVKQRVDDDAPGAPLMTYDALSVKLTQAVPDGNGGFYVMAWEYGTDGGIHATIWAMDAGDHMSRIACDPEIERLPTGGVGTLDTLYAVVEDPSLSWQVVAVSRTP